ncbi:MAG: BrxE family protein [SAR324 cluster bacterium]|nr:BrxE family protein [SAR324 cluster bacterium]
MNLRMMIGFMGEKNQADWWDSSFLSASSVTFLTPVYPKSVLLAQYNGVCQAAMRVHDSHIGIGRHYHLYRLPYSIERLLTKRLQDQECAAQMKKNIVDKDTVNSGLSKLSGSPVALSEGPIVVGDFSDKDLEGLLKKSLMYYLIAFENDRKCFPYMKC